MTTQSRGYLLKQLGIPALLGVPGTETGPWIRKSDDLFFLAIPQTPPTSEKGMGAMRRTLYFALQECLLKVSAGSICTDSVEFCGHAAVLAAKESRIPSVLILKDRAEAVRCSEIITQLDRLKFPGQMHVVIREHSERALPSIPVTFHTPRQRLDSQSSLGPIDERPDDLLIPVPPNSGNGVLWEAAGLQMRSLPELRVGINEDMDHASMDCFLGPEGLRSDVAATSRLLDSRACSPVSPVMGVYNGEGQVIGTIGWHHYHWHPHVLLYDGSIFTSQSLGAKHANYSNIIVLVSSMLAFHRDNLGTRIAFICLSPENNLGLALFSSMGFKKITRPGGEACDSARGCQLQWLRRDLQEGALYSLGS